MEPASQDILTEAANTYFENVIGILENLSDDEINNNVYENKRTIGEISRHIEVTLGFPHFVHLIGYRVILRYPPRSLLPFEYKWNMQKGKIRNPKSFDRLKLIEGLKKQKKRYADMLPKIPDRQRLPMHRMLIHLASHAKQVEILNSRIQEQKSK